MKKMFKIVMIILSPLFLFGLYVVGNLIYATLTDYKPQEKEELTTIGENDATADSTLTFMIWNIGYAGLGQDMDFFFDGGKQVKPTKEWNAKYLEEILKVSKENDDIDFMLYQEVDIKAKRSYKTNQFESIDNELSSHNSVHAVNYNVKFIPKPFENPLGSVISGLASYSKFKPSETTRYQFPGNYAWPNRIYFLDRCFLWQRYPQANGKDLVVINTHNSAYDDGTLKQQQMDYLKGFLVDEYDKGNYVVVGGDWNQCPPGFQFDQLAKDTADISQQTNIPADYLSSDWQWVYDETIATNRKLTAPYNEDETFTTVIDFFLISPNIQLEEVKGIDLNFTCSDHQPVKMRVSLK